MMINQYEHLNVMKAQYDDFKKNIYELYPNISDEQFFDVINVYAGAMALRHNDVIFAKKVAEARVKHYMNLTPVMSVIGIDVNEGQKMGIAYAIRLLKGKD
jgi:hypothetical protein